MLISYSQRFIFIHIGKTGGMSMREALQPYAQEPEKFKIRRPPKLRGDSPNPLYTVWETLLLHPTARDVQKEVPAEVFDKFYKFAFVRNPWDLQVSMYHFILREPEAAKHNEVKSLGGFDDFVEWVVATPDPYPKGIAKLQKDMITDKSGKLLVDFVGHYETLNQDFRHVTRLLDIDTVLPHLNQSKHYDYRIYYNEHTRKLIADHFQADIEMFGYSFGGYRGEPSEGVKAPKPKVKTVFEAENPQELAASYDEWAASYEADMDDSHGPQEATSVLMRYVEPDARILDAGCGTGMNGKLLARQGYRNLEGLDLSPGMLREAGKKGCYKALHRETLGETLDFPTAVFDAVLVVGVFARAHAPSRSFDELIRITKPGGHIIFTMRPEFYMSTDFKTTMAAHADAAHWQLLETTEPFDGHYKNFPGLNLQVWVYEVLPTASQTHLKSDRPLKMESAAQR